MAKFRVLVEGKNFLLRSEGSVKRYGFFTSRFVDADTRGQAEGRAISSVRELDRLRSSVLNAPDDPPMLHVCEVEEIESLEEVADLTPGLSLFEESDETDPRH